MRLAVILPLATGLSLAIPSIGYAANARNPYSNIDPRNDAGNNTGDSQVERLNEAQLDHGPALRYPGPAYARPPVAYGYPPAYAVPYARPYGYRYGYGYGY